MRDQRFGRTSANRTLCFVFILLLVLGLSPLVVQAGTFGPVSVTDQTATAPLANPSPTANEPRYVSGFGLDDSFTVFFEDRNDASQLYYVQTTTGPSGFPASATRTNIADTHFVVKDWPITIGGTTYAYRGWGSVGNDPNHKFYVTNDLANWTLVSTFQVPNASGFYGGGCYVYYGWHDVIEINGTYYAFGESNCSQTFLVRSANGDDVWESFASVGGVAGSGYGPLELPSGVSAGWTPRGNFIDLGHDRGYGKLYVNPTEAGFYLAVNTAAKASLAPADLEAAFINPANWTWHDGTTGPASNLVLSATAEHDLRECWVVPNSDPNDDWVIIYDADFGSGDGDKALGWAILAPPSVPPPEVWVDDDYDETGCTTAGHDWQYDCFDVVQDGVDAVASGGTIHVAAGTYDVPSTIVLNKAVTVSGPPGGGAVVQGTNSGVVSIFEISASNVILQNLDVTHSALPAFVSTGWAELPNSLIRIPVNLGLTGIVIADNRVYVPPQSGAMSTWNGVAICVGSGTTTDLSITGNTIHNTRNGVVVQYNNTVAIANNTIYDTKGGVMNYTNTQADADNRTLSSNTWGSTHNEWDIVWNTAYYVPDYQQSVLALSHANNEAYVLDRRAADAAACAALTGNRSHIFVDDDSTVNAPHPAKGNFNEPFQTLQLGIDAVVPGGTIYVAAGTYSQAVSLNKAAKILGAGSGTGGSVLTNPSGTDYKVGVIQLTASGTAAAPILLKDLRIQPVGLAGLSVGRFTEATGVNVDYLTLDNVHVIGTNTSPCTEQERGLYVDLTSSLRHLTVSNSAFNNLHYGWYFQKQVSADASTVQYVEVTDTTFNHNNLKGIYAEKLSDATFTDVTASQNGYDVASLGACSYFAPWLSGIDVNLKAGTYANLTFSNLTATNNGPDATSGANLAVKARGTGSDSASYLAYPATLSGVTITGGTFGGSKTGIRVGEPGKANTSPTGVNVQHASLAGNSVYGLDNQTTVQVLAENNWWGSPCPSTGVNGNVDFDPWWLDPTGTVTGTPSSLTILSGFTTAQQQAVLDCAAPGAIVTWQTSGTAYAGGIQVNTNGLTLDLNGNTVGPGSSWLIVAADDITVLGPGKIDGGGGGGGGYAGIVVNAGADNFILDSTEVTGWTDGVHVASGSHTSLKIVSNWIHSNSDDGLQIDNDCDGVVTIEGNLFKVNGSHGVEYGGASSLDVTYNSWGDPLGPAGPVGDGISGPADGDPWTYVESFFDVYLDTLALERHVPEGTSFDVGLKADAVNLYALTFKFTYDPARLTLNSTTFASPWSTACSLLPGLPPGTVAYYCYLMPPTAEWSAVAGTIATFNFTANTLGDDTPVESFFDIYEEELDTSAGAIGGQKVFVNNAGFNLPSAPTRDITDPDDGKIIIERKANYTGFVDLQGRANDSGAVLEVYSQAAKAGGIKLAQATSASSGAYTTAHVPPHWLAATYTYWLVVDRALYLPTTAVALADYDDSKQLSPSPLATLAKVLLLGGDANNNDHVEVGDLSCIGGYYGTPGGPCTGGGAGDVNGDGVVNVQDLSLAGGNLYKTSSPWTP